MNQVNSTSCNNQGMRGKNKVDLIAETALEKKQKEKNSVKKTAHILVVVIVII